MFAGGTITYAATPMEDGLLRRLRGVNKRVGGHLKIKR